ncbi:hypothetical protein V6N13_011408 [Hibiscus sabdariffa]
MNFLDWFTSLERRAGYQHHKKAGAENALVRVSAVLTNAPFILNLDCDHYVNNSKAVREAMCFLMDPQVGRDASTLWIWTTFNAQFFQVLFLIMLMVWLLLVLLPAKKSPKDPSEFYRDAKWEELDAAIFTLGRLKMSFEKTFGLSSVFIESTLMENGGVAESANPSTLIKEAIHVISCGYEEKTEWGKEVGISTLVYLMRLIMLPTLHDFLHV